jgi:hypothetical protein
MRDERDETGNDEREPRSGFGGFLRSLLSGIPWSESAHADVEMSLPTPSARRMDVLNANGKVRIVGEDRDDIHVHARKHARAECSDAAAGLLDAITVEQHVTGGVLEIEVVIPRRWNRHGTADLEVRVPRALEIHTQTSNGKLSIEGLRSAVHAVSSNGSVRVLDVVGDVDVTTANAKVVCAGTVGALVARSSNGKIQVADHRGALDASTSNGLIHARVHELAKDGVSLATSNGRIVLELPAEPDAEVDVRVDNGVIRSDFDLGQGADDEARGGRVRGRIGRGGVPIRLRTSNGTISLREADPETDGASHACDEEIEPLGAPTRRAARSA